MYAIDPQNHDRVDSRINGPRNILPIAKLLSLSS